MFGKDQEDEQAQLGMGGAPALGSSGMGAGAGNMGGGGGVPQGRAEPAAPQAPQSQSSSLGAGTGFVNIDRMIGANQGIGSHVTSFGGNALKKEGEAFDKKKNETTSQINNAPMPSVQGITGAIQNLGSDPSGQNTIMAGLNASYSGPKGMTYNIGNTGNIKSANALANSRSTGREIASQTGTLAGYDPRMSAIDSMLYGQVADAQAARTGLKNDTKQTIAQQGRAADRVAGMASNQERLAANIRADTEKKLRSYAGNIVGEAERRAANENAAGREAHKRGSQLTANPGYTLGTPTWEGQVDGAKAGNFVDQNQAGALQFISQALGDPSMALEASGPYQGGGWRADQINEEVTARDAEGKPLIATLDPVGASVKDNKIKAQEQAAAYRRQQEENSRRARLLGKFPKP
jgi:hypothetical protein